MSTAQSAAIAVGVPREWLSEDIQDKLEKIGGRVFSNNAKSSFFGIPFVEVSDSYKELDLGGEASGKFTYDLCILVEKFKKIAGIEPSVVIICDQY
jgi:hypothetical protein